MVDKTSLDIFGLVVQGASLIAAILLSYMAIVVAKRANELAEGSLRLQALEFKPAIRLEYVRQADLDYVEVWNDGAPISDYRIYQSCFLEVFRAGLAVEPEGRIIPVIYFYDWHHTGKRKGLLSTFASTRSGVFSKPANMKTVFENLRAQSWKQPHNESEASFEASGVTCFFHVVTWDVLDEDQVDGNSHVEGHVETHAIGIGDHGYPYNLPGPRLIKTISQEEGEEIRRTFHEADGPRDLAELTLEDITAEWEDLPRPFDFQSML